MEIYRLVEGHVFTNRIKSPAGTDVMRKLPAQKIVNVSTHEA